MVLAGHRRSPFLLGRYAHVKIQKLVHGTRVQAQTPLLAELSKHGHHSQAPLLACSSNHTTSPSRRIRKLSSSTHHHCVFCSQASSNWANERRLPSLSLNQAPLFGPIVEILLMVLRDGESYSSKTTPRALRAATSDSTSSTRKIAWVWVPLASP